MRYQLFQPQRAWWFQAVVLALVVSLAWAPVVASAVSTSESPAADATSAGSLDAQTRDSVDKFGDEDTPQADVLASALPKHAAPFPEPAPTASERANAGATGPARRTARANEDPAPAGAPSDSSTPRRRQSAPAKTPSPAKAPASAPKSAAASSDDSDGDSVDELATARSILSGLIASHPELAGATVSIGDTPGGYQAVAYYKSGRILISPNHRASLRTILRHEIWHILDWRDNGRIDWGENVPPR